MRDTHAREGPLTRKTLPLQRPGRAFHIDSDHTDLVNVWLPCDEISDHQLGFLVSFKPDAPLTDHLAVIRQQLPGVVVMRWIRGFPPYCVGATMNKNLRFELRTLFGLNTDPPEANAVPHYAANISRKLTPG